MIETIHLLIERRDGDKKQWVERRLDGSVMNFARIHEEEIIRSVLSEMRKELDNAETKPRRRTVKDVSGRKTESVL